ncbi:hypothetical protein PybrP1_012866 [[Pythium] brassicae (nom. inval.)]|nr:hypothetical protein PybrP1_012866 [[Pythium] brassicae (nom. inval.)]
MGGKIGGRVVCMIDGRVSDGEGVCERLSQRVPGRSVVHPTERPGATGDRVRCSGCKVKQPKATSGTCSEVIERGLRLSKRSTGILKPFKRCLKYKLADFDLEMADVYGAVRGAGSDVR